MRRPAAQGRAIGIDLGTTNSLITALEGGEVMVVPNREGQRVTPSCVAYTRSGEILVGEPAKRQAVVNPERSFRSIKRHMGEDWNTEIDGRILRPKDISAEILRKLRMDAEEHLCTEVTQAVVTVPAYFTERQRRETIEAAKQAGIDVLGIINEPTAAALAYGFGRDMSSQTILVIDLGGGTLDVSVLRIDGGHFDVLATSGDRNLGGDDWDIRIVEHLSDLLLRDHGVDVSTDPTGIQRLVTAAEEAKIALSNVHVTRVVLPFVGVGPNGPVHLDAELTRVLFEELTEDLIERCRTVCHRTLADAGLDVANVDRVIMVGGATRMPAITDLVRDLSGSSPVRPVNPDEAVALGAAIYAAMVQGHVKGLNVTEVTPMALGIEVSGGMTRPLIPKNTPVPATVTQVFTTSTDDQTSVRVRILQGDHSLAAANSVLGAIVLDNLPRGRRGSARIAVTYRIDRNGVLHVSARDSITGLEHSLNLHPAERRASEPLVLGAR